MPNEESQNDSSRNNKENKKVVTIKSVKEELATGQRFKPFFEQFNSSSVESFIKDYATEKTMWWQYGDSSIKVIEDEGQQN